MSTVRLLKDRTVSQDGKDVTQKAGSTVSVPFAVGRDLVAAGAAAYPHAAPPPVPTEAVDAVRANAELRKRLAAVEKQNEEAKVRVAALEKDNAELKDLLEKATKPAGGPK